ncbi:MAG: ROK family protein [Anaerolineae bacterium]|nr:ROK family protein [Anaerolineae bacterium]
MNDSWCIGVDLGGTSIKCGLVSPDNQIVERNSAPTLALQGPEQAAERIAQNVRVLLEYVPAGKHAQAIGICSPGPMDHATGVLIEPPNLGWKNVPFAKMVSERLNLPVTLEHDAKASALGEYHFGAGRGSDAMALIIVGTGVSAGIVIKGELYRGVHGTAGELGHITVDVDGPVCRCGSNGCVELFAAGPGIVSAYEYAAHTRVESAKAVALAAQNGDELAVRVFERAGRALGAGMGALAMLMDISTFVMFGGVVSAGELLLTPARNALKHYTYKSVGARARIVVGELGSDAGILGAVYSARAKGRGG